jgi:multicomponent Na+:H+ antiporter subunit C
MLQYASVMVMMFGLYGVLTHRNVIRIIVSLNILEIGLNLFIITVGFNGGSAPIFTSASEGLMVDPLPQALVLTSIVIGVGTTAVGLAFARNMFKKYGTLNLDEVTK